MVRHHRREPAHLLARVGHVVGHVRRRARHHLDLGRVASASSAAGAHLADDPLDDLGIGELDDDAVRDPSRDGEHPRPVAGDVDGDLGLALVPTRGGRRSRSSVRACRSPGSLIIAVERSNSSTLTGLSRSSGGRSRRGRCRSPSARPRSSWSVANALAVTVGSRVPGLVTLSPSFSVFVSSAAIVSSGYGSCQRMCESYVQPYSKPWLSASESSSTTRLAGGSGRTVTPKLST